MMIMLKGMVGDFICLMRAVEISRRMVSLYELKRSVRVELTNSAQRRYGLVLQRGLEGYLWTIPFR
jgi:hypothetical protein